MVHKLSVNVRSLLSFFDEDRTTTRHSNAIKTVAGEELMFAILLEYFRRSDIQAEVVDRRCTTGRSKGHRLDGWLKTTHLGDNQSIYYQVEVKSWSAHGVGGGARFLNPAATEDEVARYKREVWSLYWTGGRFIADGLNKVLTPMKCPVPHAVVRPLACLWALVHPDGGQSPLFSVTPSTPAPFPEVWVFSASAFLRSIVAKDPLLRLPLPELEERMRWLNTLFVN